MSRADCPMMHSSRLTVACRWSAQTSSSKDRLDAAVDVGFCGAPVRHRDAYGRLTLPGRTTEPARSVGLNTRDHVASERVAVAAVRCGKPHQDLVEDDLVQDFHARRGAEPIGEAASTLAPSIDHLRDPRTAELTDGGPDREAARTPRHLGHPVRVVALAAFAENEIARGEQTHRLAVCHRVGNERKPRVVRNVEPLMPVSAAGICVLDTSNKVTAIR